ncbi:hypothetical protein G6O67_008852 [Ophiocordyceps sinensis]|uniref:Multifunctional tryptophan biosynthesis protein n=1 Tax=Ophiocordyceps sinensis TaxID=72228 RepID=A0A8H4PF72_9HYPO|nr:hypothetical protein G6O67_008852 [Ophiocordyceps sinensis]
MASTSNLVLIDNYDSFTWNIYQYLVLEGATVHVFRNDQISLEELIQKNPTQLIISPGPGHPATDSGISRDAIRHFAGKVPIFGVCMGLQCMFDVYGGDVNSAGEWLHGKTSPLVHDSKGVFADLEQNLPVTRYHSLAGTHVTLPECLEITSWVANADGSPGIIQGIRHKTFAMEGVQFHPESILTAHGRKMIKNFLLMQGGTWEENSQLQRAASAKDAAAAPAKPKGNNILERIYASRRAAVAIQKEIPSQRMADLQAAYDLNAALLWSRSSVALRQTPFDVALMAEIKRASPSKGVFALDINAPTQARTYALAGASVISVLTEPEWFKGSLDDLRAVRQVLDGMPNRPVVLRKDFIFDEYQILEARLAGADTILLIVKMLHLELLERLYKYSLSLGMEPLVEVQNAEEMTTAVKLGARVIGVNNRNLENFEVDLDTTGRLRRMVPENTLICALSGINTHDDVLMNKNDGVNAVLVGEAIMRAPNAGVFISEALRGLEAGGRQGRRRDGSTSDLRDSVGSKPPKKPSSQRPTLWALLVRGAKRCVTHETALAISNALHSQPGRLEARAECQLSSSCATDYFTAAASRLLSSRTRLVGIFQNQPLADVLEMQRLYDLDLVQLHGDEPVEWARVIPVPVIRCFKPGQVGLGCAAALEKDAHLRVFLAGGLSPDNVAEAVDALGGLSARVLGVDVSSGVEEDGEQSLSKIAAFVEAGEEHQIVT